MALEQHDLFSGSSLVALATTFSTPMEVQNSLAPMALEQHDLFSGSSLVALATTVLIPGGTKFIGANGT